MPAGKVNEDACTGRLMRCCDKPVLEKHLKDKLGELFELDYDLLLYDVTSTYFEGQAKRTRKPSGVIHGITGRTASRSTSPWW